ncbi:phage tail tube protein [Cellulomonas denverensis]|uniref:phage tail tube protein n=1 Tax=Cellulomonas denverensis TaxID=264297 RepID=UPI00406BA92D
MTWSTSPSTPADGNIKTLLVPAIADPGAPTVDELTASGVVDISCYLTAGGFALTTDQATIADERECSTEVYGQPGRKTYSLTLTGIDNSNSANATTANKMVDTLTEGEDMYVVRRRGKSHETAVATADVVTVLPFKPGVKTEVASEANSVLRSMWTGFITGPVRVDVPVVAGA